MIYCDLDGVLVDFAKGVYGLFGKHPNELKHDEMFSVVEKHKDFWINLFKTKGGVKLWNFIKPYKPKILTGCPVIGFEQAKQAKKLWVKKNIDEKVDVICDYSINKQNHCNSQNDILIDDNINNCKRWESVGGKAIHYQNANQAISELKESLIKV